MGSVVATCWPQGTQDSVVAAQGLISCGSQLRRVQTSVVVPRGLHCSKACGIFLDQGLDPCPCIRRWILIHCATRKPSLTFKIFYLLIYLFGCVELVVGCVSCAMQDLSMQCTDCLVAAWASECGTRTLELTSSVVVACVLSCSVACGILVPRPLHGGFFTTGPPGKSHSLYFLNYLFLVFYHGKFKHSWK